jgi:hypothetical protein
MSTCEVRLFVPKGYFEWNDSCGLSFLTAIVKLTQVAKNQFGFATAILWH